MKILDEDVKVKLWKIDIGRTQLILLDTGIEDNPAGLRDITNELYVGDREKRIRQELVLGIGGIKVLELLGKDVKTYHFNEGHSAFAIIGRLQDLMINRKLSFPQAKAIIRASTVFTTHTPVIAGNENFDTKLVRKYLELPVKEIGLEFDKVAALGYINGNRDVFWLPAFAMQFSRYNFIRRQFNQQPLTGEKSHAKKPNVNLSLNTDYLTIVFARRFATYKRPTLILKDKERFSKILTNPQKPVQMIFAGKAHPSDGQGKEMIKEIVDFAREYNVEDRVVFLENYDMNIARHLYWGADVWLNNPARYMEASGTSGMKAAMNGVLHLSTLEGWWPEAYNGKNGWAISTGKLYNDANLQTVADANQLYDLLENEIAELYYNRNDTDIPHNWVAMMKSSIVSACRDFNMNRVLCDYMEKSYIPAMKDSAHISEGNYELLKQAVEEEKEFLRHWDSIKITSFSTNIEQKGRLAEGESMDVECGIQFGQARPEFFKVELFYMYDGDDSYKVLPMELAPKQGDMTYYKHSLEIEGYGSQSLNVRIKPASAIIADIHPELIKWKD